MGVRGGGAAKKRVCVHFLPATGFLISNFMSAQLKIAPPPAFSAKKEGEQSFRAAIIEQFFSWEVEKWMSGRFPE